MAGKNALKKMEQPEENNSNVEEIVLGGGSTGDTDLDELFQDLEAGLGDSMSLTGASEVPSELHMMEAGHAANTDELKALAMKELDEQGSPAPDGVKVPEAQTKKKAPVTKRISTIGMAKSEALATALGEKLDDLLTVDVNDMKLTEEERFDKRLALLDAIDKMPKKIGEKATNLFAHVSKGAQLSNYTRIAINLLASQGEMTSKQLKDAYLARPYSDGTSSSQTTQLMNLLPALGIATKGAGKLIVNDGSLLLPQLIEKLTPAE